MESEPSGPKGTPFECPPYVEAALRAIDLELGRVMWNVRQEDYDSPFSNTGHRFDGECFLVHAYDWNYFDSLEPWETDAEAPPFPVNFKWRDLEVRWYKRCGRGMELSREISPGECAEMLAECLAELERMDDANLRESESNWDKADYDDSARYGDFPLFDEPPDPAFYRDHAAARPGLGRVAEALEILDEASRGLPRRDRIDFWALVRATRTGGYLDDRLRALDGLEEMLAREPIEVRRLDLGTLEVGPAEEIEGKGDGGSPRAGSDLDPDRPCRA